MLDHQPNPPRPNTTGPEPVATSISWTNAKAHFEHSSLRESILEHAFVGDLLRCLGRRRHRDIDVLQADVDRGGYDLVVEANGISQSAANRSGIPERWPNDRSDMRSMAQTSLIVTFRSG